MPTRRWVSRGSASCRSPSMASRSCTRSPPARCWARPRSCAPGAADMTLTTTAHLTADDMIVGDSRTEATGPFAVALRLAAKRFAAAGAEVAGVGQLRLMDEQRHRPLRSAAAEAEDAADALAGHFSVSAWTHISADHRLSLPDGLVVLPLPGDLLIGPLEMPTLPASEPTPCFAGRQVETVTLDVGPKVPGDAIAGRPDDHERRVHLYVALVAGRECGHGAARIGVAGDEAAMRREVARRRRPRCVRSAATMPSA